MSKKFEFIKNAVFFSEQNPEKLASLLCTLVSDVATSVKVTGDTNILVPTGETAATKTYSASVLSQYGDAMEGQSITYSVTSTTGVSINSSTGVLSVGKTATADSVTVTATSSDKTDSVVVTLEKQVVTSVTVTGDTEITIPADDDVTETYTATVKNQYGDTMEGQSVTFSIPSTTGVSINSSSGVLTVSKTAEAGKIIVTATCSEKTGTFEVTLKAAS